MSFNITYHIKLPKLVLLPLSLLTAHCIYCLFLVNLQLTCVCLGTQWSVLLNLVWFTFNISDQQSSDGCCRMEQGFNALKLNVQAIQQQQWRWEKESQWMTEISYSPIPSQWSHFKTQINNHKTLNTWFTVETDTLSLCLISSPVSLLFIHSL